MMARVVGDLSFRVITIKEKHNDQQRILVNDQFSMVQCMMAVTPYLLVEIEGAIILLTIWLPNVCGGIIMPSSPFI